MKNDHYIALCDVSGGFAGNTPSSVRLTVYGPYNREQADKVEKLAKGFPDRTLAVVTFKTIARPPFWKFVEFIEERVATIRADQEDQRS